MQEPIDELYLTWLYEQVGSAKLKDRTKTYWSLTRQLYRYEFVWIVPNDDNRLEDGRDLRAIFLAEYGITEVDQNWLDMGCSMLEMMIALSRRLAFDTEDEPREWFWQLVDNLGMHDFNDRMYDDRIEQRVDNTLYRVVWRQYMPDGAGGLFPLQYPTQDQREVEIWYQFNAYLLEREQLIS